MKLRMIAFMAVLVAGSLGEKMEADAAQIPENMALVPAGTFMMGSPEDETLRRLDETQHQVTISRAFYIATTEVTKVKWDAVRAWGLNNGYNDLPVGRGGSQGNTSDSYPVANVTWQDAVKWCNARSELEKRTPVYTVNGTTYRMSYKNNVVCDWNVNGYRLPTEAEWEYACRAGTTTEFYTGPSTQDFSSPVDPNLDQAGWYSGNSGDTANILGIVHPVGQKKPNAWGLYDMHGNVREWCWDWYEPYSSSAVTDPKGPNAGSLYRIIRGGSWFDEARFCRSGVRDVDSCVGPGCGIYFIGFRPVLAATVTGWRQAIETQTVQPIYSEPPKKEVGKDSLVVVTHGWQPAWKPVDIEWVDTMTNAISKYLVNQGLTEWQVHAYRWVEKAHTKLPNSALDNAKEEGVSFGKYILNQGYNHVHIISHSAGAKFSQIASETIKATRSDIVVHLTFLDPFIGLGYQERDSYGKGANWADSYFSNDFETSGGVLLFTEAALKYAFNVNVTWLDTKRRKIEVVSSTASGDVSQTCYEIHSSHRWPCEFYLNTIPPSSMFGSEGTGFPLSKEGGNRDFSQYKVDRDSLRVLGNSEPSCVPNPSPNSLHIELPQDFSKLPGASVIINSPGNVIIHGIDFELRTASPAWLAAVMPITNRVNFVSLETKFTSITGAEGLLSVYWETNVIGSIDERMVSAGIHKYTFPFPETATSGTRTFGFRLDAFSAIQSSITVTNVAFGFAGVREPFSLSFVGPDANRLPILQLNGPSGYNYSVESSTDLIDWKTVMILVNTNGTVRFVEPSTNTSTTRFYRAVVP